MSRSPGWWRSRPAAIVYLSLAVVLFGLLARDNAYYLNIAVFIGIQGLVAVGLGLLMGWAGQISLGHAGFYGLGAYASAILTARWGLNPWLALLIGAGATALVAYLVGKPTLRLRGHYLAMGTLGLGLIIQIIFVQQAKWTGGPSGIPGVPYLSLAQVELSNDLRFYWLVWPIVILAVILAGNIMDSRMGRALRAVGENEGAAQAAGVDVAQAKLAVFILSAIYASVAGSLYAHFVTFVNPSPFGFAASIQFVVMVIVGGAVTVWGPLTGTAALTVLHQVIAASMHRYPILDGLEVCTYGLVLVLFLLFRPQGLVTARKRSPSPTEADT